MTESRRRVLARKAALLAGLTACAQEPPIIAVPASSSSSSESSAVPSATIAKQPPPPDSALVTYPMHGSDPVGPPVVLPPPVVWSTFLPKLSVSSKAQVSKKGMRVLVVTMSLGDELELGPPPYPAVAVAGGTIADSTWLREDHGKHLVIVTVAPNGTTPVQITLTVVHTKTGQTGHAVFDVASGKVVRLDK